MVVEYHVLMDLIAYKKNECHRFPSPSHFPAIASSGSAPQAAGADRG
jgi:hypothetical protein